MTWMHNALGALTLTALAVPLASHADPCKVEISGNDVMQYDKMELAVPASCKQITVTLHHAGRRGAGGHRGRPRQQLSRPR
jgi:azurin